MAQTHARNLSKKNDVVLDCFTGSGSTIVACSNTGRSFVGCDDNQEYVDKSITRLRELGQGEVL